MTSKQADFLPSKEYLSNIFEIVDGNLTFKYRPSEFFMTKERYLDFISNKLGKIAGSYSKRGYGKVSIDGFSFNATELAYVLQGGVVDKNKIIDHIDGNPKNNHVSNLRQASLSENSFNTKRSSKNTSGVKGVGYHSQSGRWRSRVMVNGLRLNKWHDSLSEAENHVKKMRLELHKEFSKFD